MYYQDGYIALLSFIASLMMFTFCEKLIININYHCNYINFQWLHLINYQIACAFIKKIQNSSFYSVSARAVFLGLVFSLGISIYLSTGHTWKAFGIYATILSTFHFTEFLSIAFTNPSALTSDTYIINHSYAYTLAALASWVEYLFERHYFPMIKQSLCISSIGLILCATGEILRKTAIYTAQQNFNHVVQNKKADNHSLVTHGIYNICRHPSYVGWFYWSIGTQLILQNPLCLLVYTISSWRFFNERILIEESSLIKFFGNSYMIYQRKVGTGLPFIFGYKKNIS